MANIDPLIRNNIPPGVIDIDNIDAYDRAVTNSIDAIRVEINTDEERINTLISKYKETIATHHFMGSEYPQTNKKGSVFFIFKNKVQPEPESEEGGEGEGNEDNTTDNQEIEGES